MSLLRRAVQLRPSCACSELAHACKLEQTQLTAQSGRGPGSDVRQLLPYLLLSKECDGLPQRAQHGAHFDVICGDNCGADAAAQLKLTQQLLLLLTLALPSLFATQVNNQAADQKAMGCLRGQGWLRMW